ncbi:PREDICTED: membrane-spanning 4-domains subfamily A member 12-like [Calidris pugnax]|uniref:membrane-spanning 4-domains subfamily A member 12-like n=1 Tax=Calidris pugnax TaxID=198806 RepID=UPI00071C5C03|nr:PREDICTED: membrane-spanning 4-domains subfamily A member 12-like [Calidris pugnax]
MGWGDNTYTQQCLMSFSLQGSWTIQIMTGFMHIGFGIVLTMLTNIYTSVFVIGEIPFLGGVSFIISGCISIGAEKSPTECAVKGSQTMNVISAIFALLGIVAFIVDLNLNGLYRPSFDQEGYLVLP